MFQNLKKKFISMNMIIISIIMFLSFATIYIINYGSVIDDHWNRLEKISLDDVKPNNLPHIANIIDFRDNGTNFKILVDKTYSIQSVFSILDLESEYYQDIITMVAQDEKYKGYVEVNSIKWMYSKISTDGNYLISFIDVTSAFKQLDTLLITLVVIWLLMLIIVYKVSVYFSSNAIKPIEDAFSRQTTFISDASHELKTPLAIMSANMDIVLSNENKTIKSQKKWLSYARNEISSMNNLISQLLNLITSNTEQLTIKKENLSTLLSDILLSMEVIMYEKDIQLKTSLDDNIYKEIDIEKIKQVIIILIDNAIKYTDSKGIIKVNLYKEKHNVILDVINTGVVIDKNDIQYIFDRLYKCDKARTNNNSFGLGLSIAKQILDKHKFNISVTSLDEFTRFRINM